mgnify:CR=1 FL=1
MNDAIKYLNKVISFFDKNCIDCVFPPQGPPVKTILYISIIPNFLNLTYIENTGAAWGILDNNRIILICISVITLLVINKYVKNRHH